jgi:hypothetical protein
MILHQSECICRPKYMRRLVGVKTDLFLLIIKPMSKT